MALNISSIEKAVEQGENNITILNQVTMNSLGPVTHTSDILVELSNVTINRTNLKFNITLNFTQLSQIRDIVSVGSSNSTYELINIYGNLSILNKTSGTFYENTTLNRFFPTQIKFLNGSLFTNSANINITRNSIEIFSGVTSTGLIELNLSGCATLSPHWVPINYHLEQTTLLVYDLNTAILNKEVIHLS